jgi:hypothetical protein
MTKVDKGYWFSNSSYVQKQSGKSKRRISVTSNKPDYNSSGVLRVYHSLLPKDLGDVRSTPLVKNLFKS